MYAMSFIRAAWAKETKRIDASAAAIVICQTFVFIRFSERPNTVQYPAEPTGPLLLTDHAYTRHHDFGIRHLCGKNGVVAGNVLGAHYALQQDLLFLAIHVDFSFTFYGKVAVGKDLHNLSRYRGSHGSGSRRLSGPIKSICRVGCNQVAWVCVLGRVGPGIPEKVRDTVILGRFLSCIRRRLLIGLGRLHNLYRDKIAHGSGPVITEVEVTVVASRPQTARGLFI